MSDQAVLKCRECDVEATCSPPEGDITMVRCPCCKNTATGEHLRRILREQETYLLDKAVYDDLDAGFADAFSAEDNGLEITYESGKEPVDPGWEFHFVIEG